MVRKPFVYLFLFPFIFIYNTIEQYGEIKTRHYRAGWIAEKMAITIARMEEVEAYAIASCS